MQTRRVEWECRGVVVVLVGDRTNENFINQSHFEVYTSEVIFQVPVLYICAAFHGDVISAVWYDH